MTFKEFVNEVEIAILNRPSFIREGQAVFNYIDSRYGGVARAVQYQDNVDCFHRDSEIMNFLECAYKRITKNGN